MPHASNSKALRDLKTLLDLWSSYYINAYSKDQTKQPGDKRKTKERSNKQEKGTLIKKSYELGEFGGMDMALIICKHGRYTTYGMPYSQSATARFQRARCRILRQSLPLRVESLVSIPRLSPAWEKRGLLDRKPSLGTKQVALSGFDQSQPTGRATASPLGGNSLG